MEKEQLQAYAARVSQANRSELVVIIMEAFLDSVGDGKKYLQADQISEARREIQRGKDFLTELMGSLDLQYEISYYLRRLYIYSYRELCQGVALRDAQRLDNAAKVIQKLLPSFQEVAKQDESEPVMENAEPIYAGLTYGRTSLNESLGVNVNSNRGFQA